MGGENGLKREDIVELIQGMLSDHGVPRKIRDTLEESLSILNASCSASEKIARIISALDDASSNPNLSIHARTHIWNIVSALEIEARRP